MHRPWPPPPPCQLQTRRMRSDGYFRSQLLKMFKECEGTGIFTGRLPRSNYIFMHDYTKQSRAELFYIQDSTNTGLGTYTYMHTFPPSGTYGKCLDDDRFRR
ncbi:uncharacterized protein LOC120320993 [Drosophila yakuba]|uniref:uncharacterized protein LOC120320993 n=1 Tax=Drosophila yakuba TaxID=7245 RepID=UPI0019307CEB|nr:uncharacterized protein LOC120320993 [Drosophila yakuba]